MSKTKAIEPRPQDFPVCPEPYGGSAGLLYCANAREATFSGMDRADAIRKARESGWVYAEKYDGGGIERCPECL
jgi:hypothetical protein